MKKIQELLGTNIGSPFKRSQDFLQLCRSGSAAFELEKKVLGLNLKGGGACCSTQAKDKRKPVAEEEEEDRFEGNLKRWLQQSELYFKQKAYDDMIRLLIDAINETKESANSNEKTEALQKLYEELFKGILASNKYDEGLAVLRHDKEFMEPEQLEYYRTRINDKKTRFVDSLSKEELIERVLQRKLGKDVWNKLGFEIEDPPLDIKTVITDLGYLSNRELYDLMIAVVIHEYHEEPVTIGTFKKWVTLGSCTAEEVPTTQKRCESTYEWVAFFESGSSYVSGLEDSQYGFIVSQPLDFLQCALLYNTMNDQHLFAGTLYFPKLLPIVSEMYVNQKNNTLTISKSIPQSFSGLTFTLKSLLCVNGLKNVYREIVEFNRETYKLHDSLSEEEKLAVKNGEPGNFIQVNIDECYRLNTQKKDEYPEELDPVHYRYFKRMVNNLNILHDVQPDFELVQDIYENKRFFGFYMPFQNLKMDENGKPMYDGAAHGPSCAMQTNRVYETIKNMCFRREDGQYFCDAEQLWEVTKLLGAKRIITCQDSGKKDGGTRRLIPLLFYYALVGGHDKVLKFIDAYWKDDNDKSKAAVLDLMNPKFQKKQAVKKLNVYKSLPGYIETVISKSNDKMKAEWSEKLRRYLTI